MEIKLDRMEGVLEKAGTSHKAAALLSCRYSRLQVTG